MAGDEAAPAEDAEGDPEPAPAPDALAEPAAEVEQGAAEDGAGPAGEAL